MLHHLVHLGISPWEKAVRTAPSTALLVLLHLAGKRQLAQLNSFDLVVLLLLSNVVQNAVIGPDDSLLGGLLGAAILLAVNYVIVRVAFMGPRLGRVLQGGATTVAENGKVDEKKLRHLALTRESSSTGSAGRGSSSRTPRRSRSSRRGCSTRPRSRNPRSPT